MDIVFQAFSNSPLPCIGCHLSKTTYSPAGCPSPTDSAWTWMLLPHLENDHTGHPLVHSSLRSSTQLLRGNNFNAGTWPEVFLPSLNPTGSSLAEPGCGLLLRKCPQAREVSKGADGRKRRDWRGVCHPSDWPELAPEGLLYMEKGKVPQ